MCNGYFLDQHAREKINVRRGNTQHVTTVYAEHEDEAKENNSEMSDLEKRYQEIIVTIKKSRRQKRKRST